MYVFRDQGQPNHSRVLQSRPLCPDRPPPKRDLSPVKSVPQRPPPANFKSNRVPPTRPEPVNNNRIGLSVKVSDPVLTGTTNTDTKSHVKPSPIPNHIPVQPKLTQKPKGASIDSSQKQVKTKGAPAAEPKSRFAPIFKIPSFSKSDKQGTQTSKPETSKQEDAPIVADIVKKRELTRNISNPILISTTDRRSKHLVKLDSLNVNTAAADDNKTPAPPLPPHVSLNKNEYENTAAARQNRPLPPRPMSMPVSECSDELQVNANDVQSVAIPSHSPRMPGRPPPPPIKPNVENTRKMLEDELSRLDDINVEIRLDSSPENSNTPSPVVKPKHIKPKPRVTASKSAEVSKRPTQTKPTANKRKSDIKTNPQKLVEMEKPIFNPKARPGLSAVKTASSCQSKPTQASETASLKSNVPARKPSTESLDDDPNTGAASVAGLAKKFEVQKKPLLSDRNVKRTQSQGVTKAPMTPPKPRSGVKQIRSVDV